MKIQITDYYDVLNENYILICTSNSVEKDAVNNLLTNRRELEVNLNTSGCSIGLLSNRFVIHLSGESGIGKVKSISRLIISFISNQKFPNPVQLILCGFCWGNPEKSKVGDTLVSSKVISLNSQKVEGDSVQFKDNVTTSSIQMDLISTDILASINNVVLGDIVSLETLYASTEKRDILLSGYSEVIGGEMEAFAFVPSMAHIPWLVVKSVSDNGDDDFNQDFQTEAAKLASNTVAKIVDICADNGLISLNTSTAENLMLVDRLLGKTIKLPIEELTPNNLNDYLNDVIGPQIEYKLNYYVTSDEYERSFVKHMCDLILEVIQNSIKYADSSKVEVTFNDKNIIIDDGGSDFELTALKGERGGATSWSRVNNNYIKEGKVEYVFQKKKHKFNLIKVNPSIRRIISNCSVAIIKDKIGSPWVSKSILSYDEKCDAVFVDDRQVKMQSRRNSLIKAVQQLLESGKVVYVAVNDNEDAEQYVRLKVQPELLKILVRPL
ncbi:MULTISPECIES: 5'-methylthioadenosine/S-adenosylhomocysteine nucleosidase family protein [Vibrio]|uniref:5'-methylthioadenosine/S-adenosylhomocysteine nucleosidase family protein n=1 Tax=Vibrio TaxID=662 RepID=UPI0006A9F636|nr:hypothetical protein [Vibrio nereis]